MWGEMGLLGTFVAGFMLAFLFIVFGLIPPSCRVLLFSRKKPIFLLQDGTRKLQFVVPQSIDGTKYETKKLLFDIGGRPACNMDGRRVYPAYIGYGGVLDSFGIVRTCEELHKELDGEELDPRGVIPINTPGFPEEEKNKEGFHLLKSLIKGDDGNEKEGVVGYAVTAQLPSHGIVDLSAITHFMLTNMPAITLKQYSIAQTALQRLSAMFAGEGKNWMKLIMYLIIGVVIAYLIKVLFTGDVGGSQMGQMAAGVIPGGGGVGR